MTRMRVVCNHPCCSGKAGLEVPPASCEDNYEGEGSDFPDGDIGGEEYVESVSGPRLASQSPCLNVCSYNIRISLQRIAEPSPHSVACSTCSFSNFTRTSTHFRSPVNAELHRGNC